ncbi:DnaJ domain/X-domain of DnaJ-containing, putative [Angomonas deanei]|uniref:DnaJ domain/X-domain of DnaJ-containing, putative n=1 Tax=Angomonas deanei TaxID=59799 RepID=A0A7G2C7N3_9TRYP|nr:DnaJ domain/X-domain of DnaJ-containing, putative [Angomonas deanei]
MSGLLLRRFVLQNITAVATHCPIPFIAVAARDTAASSDGKRSGLLSFFVSKTNRATDFALVTEAEMEWIKRKSEEENEDGRIVLACRPQLSFFRGVGGALLNGVVGCIVSPLIFLSMMLERMRCYQPLTAPFYGLFWAGLFLATSQYAAVQQLVLCTGYAWFNTPLYHLFNSHRITKGKEGIFAYQWNAVSCRFELPNGQLHQTHPLLEHFYKSDTIIRERGTRRLAKRDDDRKSAKYSGRAGGPAGGDNYYEILGLKPECTEKEIKAAYNRLVLKVHPDRNPSPDAAQQFDRVTKAYRVLNNPEKRRKYDVGGTKLVEDLGAKKREAVRALFGGDILCQLTGDTFFGSFSQRVIDGVDLTGEEVAVLRQRMYERCRDELLENYIDHYIASYPKGKPVATGETVKVSHSSWDNYMNMKIRKLTSTGLAKEVLHTIGQEYMRVIAYFNSELNQQGENGAAVYNSKVTIALQRLSTFYGTTLPHRLGQRQRKIKFLTTIRQDTFKNTEAMIDLAWYTSVEELETTARYVSFSVLYDPKLSEPERMLRREALHAVAQLFIRYGQAYKGANKATMNQLMDSLRDYQQQQQKEKNE